VLDDDGDGIDVSYVVRYLAVNFFSTIPVLYCSTVYYTLHCSTAHRRTVQYCTAYGTILTHRLYCTLYSFAAHYCTVSTVLLVSTLYIMYRSYLYFTLYRRLYRGWDARYTPYMYTVRRRSERTELTTPVTTRPPSLRFRSGGFGPHADHWFWNGTQRFSRLPHRPHTHIKTKSSPQHTQNTQQRTTCSWLVTAYDIYIYVWYRTVRDRLSQTKSLVYIFPVSISAQRRTTTRRQRYAQRARWTTRQTGEKSSTTTTTTLQRCGTSLRVRCHFQRKNRATAKYKLPIAPICFKNQHSISSKIGPVISPFRSLQGVVRLRHKASASALPCIAPNKYTLKLPSLPR
jgi:hypothetical protein